MFELCVLIIISIKPEMNVFVVSFPKRNVLNMRIIFAIKCLSSHNNKQIERENSLFIENDDFLARIEMI